jgi:hypothetical protein
MSGGRAHWPIIIGIALTAMTAGHALIGALGPALPYQHVAQAPAVDLAALLLAFGAWSLGARIVSAATANRSSHDWLAPAFDAMRRLGFVRLAAVVVPMQLVFLATGEAYEQHLAGIAFAGPLALFGSALWYAPIVQVAVGLAAALAGWLIAREVCRSATAAVAMVRAIVAWLSRPRVRACSALTARSIAAPIAFAKPLARKFANRPPPFVANFR